MQFEYIMYEHIYIYIYIHVYLYIYLYIYKKIRFFCIDIYEKIM